MEAKVDIRKLQLLNDRINQTIEALNQVRLSVHGLAHTAAIGQYPFATPGIGFTNPQPYPFATQVPVPGFGFPQAIPGMVPGMAAPASLQGIPPAFGLQHSPYLAASPYASVNPQSLYAFPAISGLATPAALSSLTPWASSVLAGGLFHTSPESVEQRVTEVRACDPGRILNTFPFVASPFQPVTVPAVAGAIW
jgi:hypothetical protein